MPLRAPLLLLSCWLAATAALAAEADYELAREALEAERTDEVRRLMTAPAESGDAEALHLLGRAEFAAGRVDEALEYFTKAKKKQPELSRSHFWYGRACHLKLDEAAKLFKPKWAKRMRTAFEKAHELDPSDTKPIFALARFHREAPGIVGGDREKAYAHATELARLDPVLGEPFLGGLLTEDDRHDEAVAAYRRALAASPEETSLRRAIAAALARAGHAEEAFAELDALLAIDPEDPIARVLEGFTASLTGEGLDRGRAALESYLSAPAPQGGPTHGQAQYHLGQIHEHAARVEEARTAYRACLAIHPDFDAAKDRLKALN